MSNSIRIPLSSLWRILEQRNNDIIDKVAKIYRKDVQDILMKPPFSYSETLASEIAKDIVNDGDRIRCSACLDSNDDELNEVNGIGDEFQALQKSITLKILSGNVDDMNVSNFINVDERFIHVSEVTSWRDTLTAVKEFLKTKAQQGFTATIIMLCVYTEYGLVLPSGQTVPVEILEREIQLRLNADQVLPRAVNLVIVEDGQYRQVSHIQSEYVDRIIRRFKIM